MAKQVAKNTKETVNKNKNGALKLGTVVSWKSHAMGVTTKKTGKIVAVMRPNEDYTGFVNLPQRFFEDILVGTRPELTRKEIRQMAKEAVDDNRYYGNSRYSVVEEKYKLKFGSGEGMYRSNHHYLIEVETPGEAKNFLYHPAPSQRFTVVSTN